MPKINWPRFSEAAILDQIVWDGLLLLLVMPLR